MEKGKKKNRIFRDAFGHWFILKRFLIFTFGVISYNRFNGFNKLKLKGTENLLKLPDTNVLFVSNHQTYFADVFAMYHVFCAVKHGYIDTIKNPVYLLDPKVDLYYVAAKETMNKGLLAKLFSLAGAITVKRTWRDAGKDVNRKVDMNEIDNILHALDSGWVVTFPQGTVTPWSPGRRGAAKIIKKNKPIVIPVVIDGFRRAFDRKGLLVKKRGVEPKMTFKAPLDIDYENEDSNEILAKIMIAIEQDPSFLKVKSVEELEAEREEEKTRSFFEL
ncbi:1-acyl-sn-glycerol-3-phosphate acyltransferase [Apibacter sp. B3889]|uniref:lysophospholipid acyltransferase family protein n=1 Tax=unclassified Apibacter TaxID=2630820 RepID=UPI0013230BA3|nr:MULTISPECIES: lysophospholipid acyltransferase family protein [unclassified Apibacter]MXO33879.1 1-acyl-sn-glycerol-3-phosphate acyltransferase [Apibacter sp. B3883]MXO41236.1 1-acyl-sn-glycerol-3-phosphate acyltransferase [Apibacter sp. B3889]MXP04609.1 1-acyl-sn-glycerol-3-phosphate acyltransferase [Apibacter sp. B3887]MXP06784.1 1-acyl-sn-glycerol-3-phosphate acyltransferase [Apibacter sp. B3935]